MGNTISYKVTEHQLDLGDKGAIDGLQYDNKSRRYAGIPYALPPTGEHRWKKPRPLPDNYTYSGPNGSAFDARKFGPICSQPKYKIVDKNNPPEDVHSEDCLRLNIWTPVEATKQSTKKWPVMLWLHGGWFQIGDPSHEPGMDPTELISTGQLNAVFVAIGYRLNIFGFLAGTALTDEGEVGGNYGLWDQRLAIEWVQKNIHHFNGDPSNVTLAGRSAGSYSVQAQALYEFRSSSSLNSTSPFHRMVMISNAIPAQPKTPADCDEQFNEVCTYFDISLSATGKEKLAALRGIDATHLIKAIPKFKYHTFRPTTDNEFILPGIHEYQRSGQFAQEFIQRKFRLIIGEVLNEETLYAATNGPTEGNIEALRVQVENYYAPEVTDRVLKYYKLPDTDDKKAWSKVFGDVISDGQVRAPSRELVRNLAEKGVNIKDVWRYQIAYRLSFITEKVAPASFGVAHAMDKPLWNFSITYGPEPEELVLMKDWICDLVAFVNDEKVHQYGTTKDEEFKVATPQRDIQVSKDERWHKLLDLAHVFSP